MISIVEELEAGLRAAGPIYGTERYELALERLEALDTCLRNWALAYPVEVFPALEEGELKHAMALVNAEDRNQSARLYAEWARHIVGSIAEALQNPGSRRG